MVKKEQSQVEQNSEQEKMMPAKTTFGWFLAFRTLLGYLLIIAVFGTGAYVLYQNPHILQKGYFDKKDDVAAQNEVLTVQIHQLQNQLASLQSQVLGISIPDVSVFEDKVASLEKMNLNVIDSKADASIVLGMLTRVDKLENRLDRLAKISDDGALILSAAMLVKQAAEEGGNFIYEAEILNQLTPNTASVKKDVSVIIEYARNGIVSKKGLERRFAEIYKASQSQEEAADKDWKERLNDKLNEYIKINKTGTEPESVRQNPLDGIAPLVADGQIKKAVELIESSENDDIRQNKLLQEWLADAANMLSFKQAVRNIAAYSLAEMKVNNLKNKE